MAGTAPVGDAGSVTPLGPTTTVFTYESGYQSLSFAIPTTGAHSIAFGVVDVNDTLGASGLLVDDVQVAAVPEPSSIALLLAGLALVAVMGRRQIAGQVIVRCIVGLHTVRLYRDAKHLLRGSDTLRPSDNFLAAIHKLGSKLFHQGIAALRIQGFKRRCRAS